jgi:hypothetical protein
MADRKFDLLPQDSVYHEGLVNQGETDRKFDLLPQDSVYHEGLVNQGEAGGQGRQGG